MELWMTWANGAGSAIVDLGSPLGNGTKIAQGGAETPTKAPIVGYSVLQAESMAAAKKLIEGHPHLLMPGFSIELFETFAMPA
jgi:hypothetical protein